jgi:hypothetical protein
MRMNLENLRDEEGTLGRGYLRHMKRIDEFHAGSVRPPPYVGSASSSGTTRSRNTSS